ncbi:ribose ABC transporter permease [Pseudonocardia ailaonensis]|uniref:Ribose ABC transporter permease n=1 Tax=Pseudonocardia ailaonensis TaxID=367279 RepID=A0ABN2MJC5_9PSEU
MSDGAGSAPGALGTLGRVLTERARPSPVIVGAGSLCVLLVVAFAVSTDRFLTADNAGVVATQVAVLGLVTLGQMIVLLAGGFDISISGVVPLSAVLYVTLSNAGMPTVVVLVVVLLAGALIGTVNGLIVTKLKVNPLIATLGTMSVCQGFAFVVTDGRTVPLESAGAGFLADRTPFGVPVFVLVFIGIAAALFVYLKWTIPGRALYAVGGGPEAARLAGMRADLTKTSAFAISATLAALAGIVLSSQLLAGAPSVGADMTLTSITAAVLGGASLHGGIGGVPGTLLGIVIIGTLRDGLALLEVSAFYQLVATGFVLLIAVSMAQLKLPARRRRSRPAPENHVPDKTYERTAR